jgi:hypothetical protein
VRRPSVDPAFTFALSLVLSLLLCYPTFMHMLHGSVDVTEGAIRYLVALAISWCGVHGVGTLVAGYSAQPRRPMPPTHPPGIAQPLRRRDDTDDTQNHEADAA